MTRHQKESKRAAKRALELYEIGQKEEARRIAKKVSWRTLFLETYKESFATYTAIEITDKLKGVEQ